MGCSLHKEKTIFQNKHSESLNDNKIKTAIDDLQSNQPTKSPSQLGQIKAKMKNEQQLRKIKQLIFLDRNSKKDPFIQKTSERQKYELTLIRLIAS